MKKLAIIGASYLQEPLIKTAKKMGIETHVFAWAAGDVGEAIADYFYPISITEKDEILKKCQEIGIDGICSIASDLAVVTVNYVAENMGLTSNSIASTLKTTNKHEMRKAFEEHGDPSPRSILVHSAKEVIDNHLRYPIIIKPLDRSGSRGIKKIDIENEAVIEEAIRNASECGFVKGALAEEYLEGKEYSVEYVSYRGEHQFLALTEKYTTGAPTFIETGHAEPAKVSTAVLDTVKTVVEHALTSLDIKYGASHSEVKINDDGYVGIVEIGARMGGDFIGSTLVKQSTGIDFVKAVIEIALGEKPELAMEGEKSPVGVRFIMNDDDIKAFAELEAEHPSWIIDSDVPVEVKSTATDSSNRSGYYIFKAPCIEDVENRLK